MTDINDWPSLVNFTTLNNHEYTIVPLNAYQMGNLLDALLQSEDNGDWWGELCDIIYVAMKASGLVALNSNRGKVFTLDDVADRLYSHRYGAKSRMAQ